MAKQRTEHLGEALPARAAPASDPLRRWKVQLPGNPSRVVHAHDSDHAYTAYCRLLGIVASDHVPDIAEYDGPGE